MNSHVHLVVQVAVKPLSKIMQNLSSRYTRWSSHCAYCGKETIPWRAIAVVLAEFSPKLAAARKRYAAFVVEGHRSEFHGTGSGDTRMLGESTFVERVLSEAEEIPRPDQITPNAACSGS